MNPTDSNATAIHPAIVRIWHWTNVVAMVIMIMSGWRIYNASPIFPFTFPSEITLGGWLGGALQWHFAAMWLLVANFLVYLVYGFGWRHFARRLLPIRPSEVRHDLGQALRLKLDHGGHDYNAVQRLFYVSVLAAIAVTILSGLAVWKPVQLSWLATLMGDYEGARIVHFLGMTAIVLFILVHLTLVVLVPRTFLPILTGGRRSAKVAPTSTSSARGERA